MKPCSMYMFFALFWEQWFFLFYLCLPQTKKVVPLFFFRHMQIWCCHLCVFLFLYVQWNVHPIYLDLICMYFDKANLLMKLRDCLENCIYENNAHCFYEIVATTPMGDNRGLQCFSRCLTSIPFILAMVKMKRRLWECWFRWRSGESEPTATTHSSQLGMPSRLHTEAGHEELWIRSELWCHLV
jgi:hypothetical protein